MTIKEIEELSGMTRANIRFYEAEGLLTPARNSNGYRNYTEKDLEQLMRIRLLRSLHLSLEDIRQANSGEKELSDVLLNHLRDLKAEQSSLSRCQAVCEQMCLDHVSFDTFDAHGYLDLLQVPPQDLPEELAEDTVPKVTAPWHRFFARDIDFILYSLIWSAFLTFVLDININAEQPMSHRLFMPTLILSAVGAILVQNAAVLFFEPLLLKYTGTTPGKFLFGIRVTTFNGERLTYRAGLRRTWDVLRRGHGFFIPIYWLVRLYKSYRACKNEETLSWEEDSALHLKTERLPLGILAWLSATLLSLVLEYVMCQNAAIPPNRGELTAGEFCENFNDTQRFFGVERQLNLPPSISSGILAVPDSALYLKENGNWMKVPGHPYIVQNGVYAPLPALQFTEKDGAVTAVSFSYSIENKNTTISSYGELMGLAAVSYVCAQEDYSLLPDVPEKLFNRIRERGDYFEDFHFTEAGVTVECDFEFEGYELTDDAFDSMMLRPTYGENAQFSVEFSMKTN